MNFCITLFEGTDTIIFGMTREEVRAILGKEPELFKKSKFDLHMTENYSDICHVYYDNSSCVAFEFFAPSQVFYNNTQLIGQERKNVDALFCNLEGYESNSDGISVFNNDFSVFAPFNHIESVYISRKGYSQEQYDFYTKAYEEEYGL